MFLCKLNNFVEKSPPHDTLNNEQEDKRNIAEKKKITLRVPTNSLKLK